MKRILIDDVKHVVCAVYNVSRAELVGKRRFQRLAFPRQVAMFLARRLTTLSLNQIGRAFGGRNHTTVRHAAQRMQRPPPKGMTLDLADLEQRIRARAAARREHEEFGALLDRIVACAHAWPVEEAGAG